MTYRQTRWLGLPGADSPTGASARLLLCDIAHAEVHLPEVK